MHWRQILVDAEDKSAVKCVIFMHDDDNIVVTGHASGSVLLWNVATALMQKAFKGHTVCIHDIRIKSEKLQYEIYAIFNSFELCECP